MNRSKRYSPEIRECAVRMVFEHQSEYESELPFHVFDIKQDWLYDGDFA